MASIRANLRFILVSTFVVAGLVLVSRYSYPLFHTIVEVFCTVIAGAAFVLIWNARRVLERDYLLLLGIAFLFFAVLNVPHMLAYRGVEIFPGFDTNLPTQLFIAQRYMLSASFLAAPAFLERRLNVPVALAVYSAVTLSVLGSLFVWPVFPDAFVEGEGLTRFKIVSEYVISAAFVASAALLLRRRRLLARRTFSLVVGATLAFVVSEVMFTLYGSPFGPFNLMGHLAQVLAFVLVYIAIVRDGLVQPYTLLYRELAQSEERYRHVAETLQTAILGLPQVIQGVRVSHGYRASSEVARIGGDFYDVFGVGERRIAFLLGDVSGKGLTAAATTMQVKSTIRALAHDGADPGEVLRRANVVLSRDLEEGQFVTAVLGVLDTTEGTVALVSAGHEPPVVCSAGGCGLVGLPANLPLGVEPDTLFDLVELRLGHGEGLVLYTDGVVDATRGGEPFGRERLRRLVERSGAGDARRLSDEIMAAVLEYAAGRLADDVAILGLEYVGRAEDEGR